jgi:hypothetical protein
MSSPKSTRPRHTGTSYIKHSVSSIVFGFALNNVRFSVVAANPDEEAGEALIPADYNYDDSIEGRILNEIIDLSVHDGDAPWDPAKREATKRLKKQLADLAADACLPTMRRLAPAQIPAAQTLQDHLYPPAYTLQVFTEGDKLTCRTLDDRTALRLRERHPSVPKERLRAMELDLDTTDLLVVKPSQVILVHHLHHLVSRVTVGGEEMISKASLDLFEHAVGDELATYLKIRAAGVKLRVPELKGRCLLP